MSSFRLPNGVLNVVPIDQEKFGSIEHAIFSKLIFTGSLERSNYFGKLSAEANIPCETLIPKRPVVIVYEKVDIHSATNGILEAFFSHDTRVFNFCYVYLKMILISSKILLEYLLTICFSNC